MSVRRRPLGRVHGVAALAAMITCALVLPAGASAVSGGPGDLFSDNILFQYGDVTGLDDISTYTEDSNETLTPANSTAKWCIDGVTANDTWMMQKTAWFMFYGSGRDATVTVDNAGFDTVVAVWTRQPNGEFDGFQGCNDDAVSGDTSSSRLTISNTESDTPYYVQVGCRAYYRPPPTNTYDPCAPTQAAAHFDVSASTPATSNDAKSSPATLGTAPVDGDTFGASTENGENHTCTTDTYGATVWYRWHAPNAGDATFTVDSTGHSVIAVLGPTGAELGCTVAEGAGKQARVEVKGIKSAGDYLVKVGGHTMNGYTDEAPFTLRADFTENTDRDGDKDGNSTDCAPDDPTRAHTKPEINNNDVDENCDGIVAYDRDGDTHLAKPGGDDCDDANAAIHPGATDTPGNGVNEDCSPDGPAVRRMRQVRGDFNGGATFVGPRFLGYFAKAIRLSNLEKGARVEVRCRGRLKCTSFTFTAKSTRRSIWLLKSHRPVKLPTGAIFDVKMYSPGSSYVQGDYVSLQPTKRGQKTCSGLLATGKSSIQGKACKPRR